MTPPLRLGSRGDEVRLVQVELILAGLLTGSTADGIYGPRTRDAVVSWQRSHGLTPDGIVGPITWQSIMADVPGARFDVVTSGVPSEVFELSEAFESFRPVPYQDSAGVWTIGIGSTRAMDGKPVTASTPAVTRMQAEEMAKRDLAHAADLLSKDFPEGLPPRWWAVGVLLNNNLGRMSVWGATLLRLLRAQDWRGAAEQLKAYRNAGGKPLTGLRRRRWAEAAYALGMAPDEARQRAWAEIHTPDGWPTLPVVSA